MSQGMCLHFRVFIQACLAMKRLLQLGLRGVGKMRWSDISIVLWIFITRDMSNIEQNI